MCGRYSLATPELRGLDDRFTFRGEGLDYEPCYNIAPTQEVLAVTGNGEREAQYMRWGIIPFWSKTEKTKYSMFNARDDKLLESKVFSSLLPGRRCLIIADGFYEWRKEADGSKTPMRITLKGGEPFAFAGLWSPWRDSETLETVSTCTIITTRPNELMATIHNRMPVILPYEAEELWLDYAVQSTGTLMSLLSPLPADSLEAYQVSRLVNLVKNDVSECILPVPPE